MAVLQMNRFRFGRGRSSERIARTGFTHLSRVVGEPGSLVGTLKVRAKELTCVAWIHPHLFVPPHR
jgi:hypothetical protein